MKKVIVLLLSFVLVASMPIYALAAGTTGLDVSYSLDENGNIIVFASIVDINDSVGLAGIQYEIVYDSSVLELQSADVQIPNAWQAYTSGEDPMVENFSGALSDNVYCWCIVSALAEPGIQENGQFTIQLVFKPLAESSVKIGFNSIMSCNINIEEVESASKSVDIDIASLKANETVSVGEESESGGNDEPDSNENDNNSVTADDSDAVNDDNFASGGPTSVSESVNSGSHESTNEVVSNANNSNNGSDNDDKDNSIVIISILVASLIIGVVVFLLIKSKKGKK